MARVTGADPGAHVRQFHIVDVAGRIAQHTGKQCVDWCGAIAGKDFSVAGNMLAGPRVIAATAEAFQKTEKPFAEKLIAALEAGEAAGGDKRGKQSAALLVYTGEEYPQLDLRVDDHPDPLAELRRLHDKAHERFIPFMRCGPSQARPWGILDRAAIEKEIERYKKPA